MEDEHEMCQNCKRDIPVGNYRVHTAHCARNVAACQHCPAKLPRSEIDSHYETAHAIKICDQCGISVEAGKLHDHRSALCPKLPLICKYCGAEHPASDMSEHEAACGAQREQCGRCEAWITLKDWDKHMSQRHGVLVQRSPNRMRKPIALQGNVPDANITDTSTMLPCEFCEGLVPMQKLLEHQAECVNPTNVRGSATLQAGDSLQRPASAMARSHSMTAAASHHEPQIRRALVRQTSSRPAEEEQQGRNTDRRQSHHHRPQSSASTYLSPSYASSLNRTSSVREARATTEERASAAVTLSPSLYRHSSFNDRPSSYRRRAESLSRHSSSSRYSAYSSAYSAAPDYVSASRRTSLFNGYSGFAMYSSISQGLDEITYGGRLSRRNSVTDNRTRGSVTNIAAANDYSLPTLLATYEATRTAVASSSSAGADAAQNSGRDSASRQTSRQMSRQQSHKAEASESAPAAAPLPPKSKLKRRVSFTDKEPVIIARRDEEGDDEDEGDLPEPRKPRRKKERDPAVAVRQKHKKKREKSAEPMAAREQRAEVEVARERRRSQPVGDELFEQVSTRLKEFEFQQKRSTESCGPERAEATAVAEASPVKVAYAVRYPDPAFEDLSSACSSKGMTSSEASPPQKPRQNRNSGIFASSSSSSPGTAAASADATDPFCPGATSVQYREKAGAPSSRSGSKRNSLDGKTVQGLAQDLAAECAKAYALMESSLSKLSSEFGGGPFGMASKSKKRSKSRSSTQDPS